MLRICGSRARPWHECKCPGVVCRQEQQKRLRLNGNSQELFHKRITHIQMLAICEVLADCISVEYLDLSHNDPTPACKHGETEAATCGDNCAKAVARLLRTNTALKYLMLEGNAISHKGAAHLAAPVANGSAMSLQVLNISSNPLGCQVRQTATATLLMDW
jgi:hypothetical protein